MPEATRPRTKNTNMTLSQCEEAIEKWFHDCKPADPVHAFEVAVCNWSPAVSPTVRHLSSVEKDLRTDIPVKRGSRPSVQGSRPSDKGNSPR